MIEHDLISRLRTWACRPKLPAMHIRIIAVGKPSLPWARDGIADYLRRLQRSTRAEVEFIREGTAEQNSGRLLKASEGCLRVVLDERGRLHDTAAARQCVDRWERDPGVKCAAFLIGGADGHTDALRREAGELWALSPLTLQHELALVVLLEQLYRIHTIKRGEPYHR
jgi:23S rRNA (pseudouridine1915-N3)-methyltransferase